MPRTIVITGASSGLGRALALDLARDRERLILTGRDPQRTAEVLAAAREMGAAADSRAFTADLSRFEGVVDLCDFILGEAPQLDVLVNNAALGPGAPGAKREVNGDGIELRFAVNYLAPYLLTKRLQDRLTESAPARIVNVASAGQQDIDFDNVMLEHGYEGWRAYRQSKLALIMLTLDTAEELREDGVTANALHPATLMDTAMVREAEAGTRDELAQGVAATKRLVSSDEVADVTGVYFDGTAQARPREQALDPGARRRLSELAHKLIPAVI